MKQKVWLCLPLMAGLIFLISGSAMAQVPFAEDFEDGDVSDWTLFPEPKAAYPWTIKGWLTTDGTQVYHLEGGLSWGGGNAVFYHPATMGTDYCIQAQVKIVTVRCGGSHTALVARFRGDASFYQFYHFSLNGDGQGGIGCSISLDDNWTGKNFQSHSAAELAQMGLSLSTGQWITLKMKLLGDWIRCYINNVLVMDVHDNTIAGGSIGFFNAGAESRFDNVQVTPLHNVVVDVKPGSDANCINCKNANGVITVALLTTDLFAATQVDHTTVRFGKTGTEAAEMHTKNGVARRHEEDVDWDGDLDMVFHFKFQDTDLDCDDTNAVLTGCTFNGEEIYGCDAVRMVDPMKALTTAIEKWLKNFPNPFNNETQIQYHLQQSGTVRLVIYNFLGQQVRLLADEYQLSGDYQLLWDGRDDAGHVLGSGVYLCRLELPEMQHMETCKLYLLK